MIIVYKHSKYSISLPRHNVMRFNNLVNNCGVFYKLANEILPPKFDEMEEFEIPKAPRLPKNMQETVRPIKLRHDKKDDYKEKNDEEYEDEYDYTILAPESLHSIDIPKSPKVPREFAITERPKKSQ